MGKLADYFKEKEKNGDNRSNAWITRKYDEYEVVYRRIQEVFYRTNFGWVENLVDELFEGIDSDILEKKYDIVISWETKKDIKDAGKRSKLLILYASYSNKKIDIRLSQKAVKIIDEKKDYYKRSLGIEIVDCLTHEDTHRQQDQPGSEKEPYILREKDNSYPYYKQHKEIEAYARQVACQLERINIPKAPFDIRNGPIIDTMKKIVSKDTSLLSQLPLDSQNTIERYRYYGGKEWRKFLEEIYGYFIEPENTPISR
jgi:hypothetical protein